MKRYFFLLPAILLVACSDKKSPEIFQGELDIGTPVKLTIQQQITEWYRLQEEERRRLDEQRRPPDQPPDEPPEEGDQALNPPEGEVPPDAAERPGEPPAEEGVEAEPLGGEERPVEDGGILEDGGTVRDVGDGPRFEDVDNPPAETEEPRIFAQANPRSARALRPEDCDASRGMVFERGSCVCNEEAGFYTPPAGYAEEDSQGRRRCLRKVSQANLTLYVGSIADSGVGNVNQRDNILFEICKDPPLLPVVDTRCFVSKFHPSVDLARHGRPVIQFGRTHVNTAGNRVSSSSLRISAKQIEQLYYPDDVQYLMLRPNPADPNTDELFLAGIKFEIETGENAPPVVVYDNRLLLRWIGKDGSDFHISPISIHHDDAWFVYIETLGNVDEGTDCGISLRIPLSTNGSLPNTTRTWIRETSYHAGGIPTLSLPSSVNALLVSLDYSDYDDFGDNPGDWGWVYGGESSGSEARTSYAFTVYDGHYQMQDKYSLWTDCGDAWKPHKVKVAHIMPGYGGFLRGGTCTKDSRTIDLWLSTDSDEGQLSWPSTNQTLSIGDCRDISELQLQESRWGLPILEH